MTALTCATVAALVVSLALPSAASAAPPDSATLVSPPDGGTTASVTPTLSIAAHDPDGGSLDVTFEGRELGATVAGDSDAAPFTLVVLPDTQNYSYANEAILDTQLEWVRDSIDELDTAFVVQVGDLVSEWDIPRHWNNISGAFEILDQAAVPYTVLPGNHDFDNATGDMSVFNSHFPPTRFSGAAWNTAETRYGGYLGQDQFGADPIDRGNADNYALFSAGGTDFLVLNLEWEAPGYALDWADRVIDAHPDRTVIMATHSFLTVNGLRMATPQRPGGTSTAALWSNFVSTHCQIRLVLAGHANSGDLGEAHRTDDNACGQPVQQILTDYQSRANGGNGWLRAYRFDPAASTMTATTYSPSLDQYETDADSAFTLPFELAAPEPAPFVTIASRTVTAGEVASAPWSGLEHDTEYEWRATVDDGTTRATSATWALRTAPVPQAVLAADAFGRALTGEWGTADVGGAWTASGGSSTPFSVSGGTGNMTLMPGQTRVATLSSVSTDDAVIDVQLSSDIASVSGAAHTTIIGRSVGNATYGLNVRFEPDGVLRLYLLRGNSTALDTHVTTWQPGQPMTARLSVTGTSPTRLAASVWPTGDPAPSEWQLAADDATPALQTPGTLAIKTSVSSSSAVPTTRLAFDDFRAVTSTAEPPSNSPPTAQFTAAATALTVTADASGSSDSDGTIGSYAWQFGDGSSAAGATAEHTYAGAGTYTVTLTVVDDNGATDVATRSVAVNSDPPPPPPNEAPSAVISAPVAEGRAIAVSGAGSTDADGTVTAYAWQFGDGGTATGATADHTYAADGTYRITLTITDDEGATATASRDVTVADAPPQDDVIAADAFERTVGSGWGTADIGGAWSTSGSSTPLSVASGTGAMTLIPGQTRSATLSSVSTDDAIVEVQLSSDTATAGGAAHTTVIGRQVGGAYYGLTVRFEPSGQLRVYLVRNNAAMAVRTASWVPGQSFAARVSVTGSNPTALAASIWSLSTPEPSGWQMTGTDGSAELQTSGTIAIRSSVSSSSSVSSTRLAFDNLRVTSSTTASPPSQNQAPTAIIAAPTIDGRAVVVSSAGSADPDGTVTAYAWQFGDGTSGSGATAEHTYASDGEYTITLTVTDDDGAADVTTRSISVAEPSEPPAGDPLAADAFGRALTGEWGTADVGGAWTASGGSSTPFSVSGGTGNMTLMPGQTRVATLSSISTDDAVIDVQLSSDIASVSGAAHTTIIGRSVGNATYGLNVRFEPDGVLRLYLLRGNSTALDTHVTTWQPGQPLTARLAVSGTNPTQLSASIWPIGQAPPSAWQLTASDTTPALQAAGTLAIHASVSSSSTVQTTTLHIDDYRALTP